MTTPVGQESSISYGAYPYGYMNGLQIFNDATTPNTLLDIGSGVTIDSTDTFQMINNGTIVINAATNGLNGLDTGTFAEGTVYAVYLVSDPVSLQPIGAMISLSYTAPLMPFGYSAFRLIGFATTNASSAHFLPGYWTAGNSGSREFFYDALQVTNITAGNATSFATTPVNLISTVPNVNNTPVYISTLYTPNAASNYMSLQPANATGTALSVIAQVAHVVVETQNYLVAQQLSISSVISPAIRYLVSSSSDAVAIDVYGYKFYV